MGGKRECDRMVRGWYIQAHGAVRGKMTAEQIEGNRRDKQRVREGEKGNHESIRGFWRLAANNGILQPPPSFRFPQLLKTRNCDKKKRQLTD